MWSFFKFFLFKHYEKLLEKCLVFVSLALFLFIGIILTSYESLYIIFLSLSSLISGYGGIDIYIRYGRIDIYIRYGRIFIYIMYGWFNVLSGLGGLMFYLVWEDRYLYQVWGVINKIKIEDSKTQEIIFGTWNFMM